MRKTERIPTGVKGLDKLTESGFEKNSAVLVMGGGGSGKSIFSFQPFTTPRGLILATSLEIPAPSATLTTLSTFL